ncbi:hypothetical protein LTR91_024167 [Friedmanniomyces endolithicus]|uniref:Uncharacterized protein n=1 Tax=Friedmanniomyces endolithicus TaxID=329885 RepID=A0AAN6JXR9_9PEZI|nr:hypothetical protein LTR35_006708 [Friedmanniomyces endolithicus]KAK0314991.1 hypothetical protein LTR82_012772 [Friedmanniomyces endolithicus]KAK0928167.1 hypothetical protein LTR57_002901 [Friedmanniomyces endolithicus]KAK0952849.1 hypothetical protein LTR91_024167 [Friedmanniomyces endolithicus]KAK0975559.1 hypothetical protein LTR54_016761 [Friedmanniomyces endolithicus]
MLALVAGLLFATLSFSAPITGNEKIVNAMSAETLAKRDGLLECNLGGVPTEADWQVRDSVQTFCTSQALGGNHAVVKPASQNPTVLYPIMATYYQDDVHHVQHHITLSIANISPSNPYTVNYNDCLKAFFALDDACAAVHTGGTWITGDVFWSFDIDDAVEGPTKRDLLECNLGGVRLEDDTLVHDAITSFCTQNSQLDNHAVAKPASQNPAVLYPIVATYFESARFEPINSLTLMIANHNVDKPYLVDYNECYNALMTITSACSAQHTGGTYDADGVYWSYDINNAGEGPVQRSIGEASFVTASTEVKRSVISAAIAEVARRQAPTVICQVPRYATTRTSQQVVMAAFSQYCAFNTGVHLAPGGSANQEQTLGGNYGKAIFGIDITDKKDGYTVEFEGCMGLFTTIMNYCGWSPSDGGQYTQGGRLQLPGGEVTYIMDLEPDKN